MTSPINLLANARTAAIMIENNPNDLEAYLIENPIHFPSRVSLAAKHLLHKQRIDILFSCFSPRDLEISKKENHQKILCVELANTPSVKIICDANKKVLLDCPWGRRIIEQHDKTRIYSNS